MCVVLTCVSEKLKFTPTPQPAQCLELDKEITIQCSAKGREPPTIRWTKAGVARSGLNRINNDYLGHSCVTIPSKMQSAPFFPFLANDDKCDFHGNKQKHNLQQTEGGEIHHHGSFLPTSVFITKPILPLVHHQTQSS